MSKQQEVLICIPDAILNEQVVHGGFKKFESIYAVDHLKKMLPHLVLLPRDEELEKDPSIKQLVNYTVIMRAAKEADLEFLQFQRCKKTSTEQRLGGKRSIGIGGHMNREDLNGNELGRIEVNLMVELMKLAAARELNEELLITGTGILSHEIQGLIIDNSDEVGSVHIGFIHTVLIDDSTEIKANEDCMQDLEWQTLSQLRVKDIENRDYFEGWSKMLISGMLLQ